MSITREFDYALRIVRALACADPDERKVAKDICDSENIPLPFAYKILKKLEQADIVQSFKGPHGGYKLLRPATDINMYDIHLAVEGELYVNECLQSDYHCPNNRDDRRCMIHTELRDIQEKIVGELSRRNLAEILQL